MPRQRAKKCFGSIRGAAAAAAGRRHVDSGEACQDAAELRRGRKVAVAVVADGCGSASHGRLGAITAVEAASELVINRVQWLLAAETPDEACELLLSVVVDAIRSAASRQGVSAASLATTLSFAALAGDELLLCQMGDSPIVLQKIDGSLEVAFPGKAGSALNETHFITSSTALDHILIGRLPAAKYQAALVMSDGLAESLVVRRSNSAAPVCQTILKVIDSHHRCGADRWLKNELSLGPLRDRTTDDLGAAALIWQRGPGE